MSSVLKFLAFFVAIWITFAVVEYSEKISEKGLESVIEEIWNGKGTVEKK